jgi:hypothetical protein
MMGPWEETMALSDEEQKPYFMELQSRVKEAARDYDLSVKAAQSDYQERTGWRVTSLELHHDVGTNEVHVEISTAPLD